ncbi:hypothetical protein SE17_12255 [Kouleothrix aurantiaca]|uniref:Uncharacterized protein n=1 Tax=Kouleothrix aurantiaca TaxID=186479 RepID=A0A0P9D208_9CHLR|nr:hypothetical protein SE17_12255 [Kouleothrix aurantiaca]
MLRVTIDTFSMNLIQHRYDITGGLRLDLEDVQGFPYCVVSHNIPERPLPEGEVWAKLHDGQADIVMQLIAAMRITPRMQAIIVEEAQQADHAARTTPKRQAPSPEALEAKRKRLVQIYLDGLIDEADYQRQLVQLQQQIADASMAQPTEQQPELEDVLTLLTDLPSLVAAATREELRDLIAPVIERVWVAPHAVQGVTPSPAFAGALRVIWRENDWEHEAHSASGSDSLDEVNRGCLTGFWHPLPPPLLSVDRVALAI